jgi:hypothetical protein
MKKTLTLAIVAAAFLALTGCSSMMGGKCGGSKCGSETKEAKKCGAQKKCGGEAKKCGANNDGKCGTEKKCGAN